MKQSNIFKAWHLIETLSPADMIKREKRNYKIKTAIKILSTREYTVKGINTKLPLPWEEKKMYITTAGKQVYYRCYIGVYERYHLTEITRTYYENNPKELINLDRNLTYIASIDIDKNGNYLEESLFIPHVSYLLGLLQSQQEIPFDRLEENFMHLEKVLQDKVSETLINGVLGIYLEEVLQLLEHKLHVNMHSLLEDNHKADRFYLGFMSGDEIEMNSHYISDFEKILQHHTLPEPLLTYVSSNEHSARQTIDENQALIQNILAPENIPVARWPSPVEHRLSLMQQASVNLIVNDKKQKAIHSVNGPPGTGKTTLLQDVFANIVTERALQMVKLKDPQEGFHYRRNVKINTFQYGFYELDPSLKGYRMVVASSNNAAVENISKELPEKENMIRKKSKKQPKTDRERFSEQCDKTYAEITTDLDYFPETASQLNKQQKQSKSNDVWGLFSVALGKSSNITTYTEAMTFKSNEKDSKKSFVDQIKEPRYTSEDWQKATNEFKQLYKEIEMEKSELQKFAKQHATYKQILTANNKLKQTIFNDIARSEEMTNKLEQINQEMKDYEIKLSYQPKVNNLMAMFSKKKQSQSAKRQETMDILANLQQQKMNTKKSLVSIKKELEESHILLQKNEQSIEQFTALKAQYKLEYLVIPTATYWSAENKDYRQKEIPWITDSLNHKRSLLFLQALKIHKLFIHFNGKAISNSIRLYHHRKSIDRNTDLDVIQKVWDAIHICTPVISSTFASIGRMFQDIPPHSIDYLFIDEAGQAVPSYAAGAIFRSNKVIAVGDPLQIEPVVTSDQTILHDIRKYFNVDEKLIDPSSSVQVLADDVNPYGMNNKNKQWVGVPLWVHRRCNEPMFSIANEMAYDNKMVFATNGKELNDSLGPSRWIDVKGKVKGRQYVEAEGNVLATELRTLFMNEETEIKLKDIFIISPFTEVCSKVRSLLKKELSNIVSIKGELTSWLRTNIGTVHTFQGKEAHTVFLLCGTDSTTEGAANWICAKPNLLNVAVTRAKCRFILIGDKDHLKDRAFFHIIHKYLKE